MPILPGSMVVIARSASGPWQSSMKRTERPASRCSGITSCAVDMSGRDFALGPAEMRQQQHDRAAVAELEHRRQHRAKPRVVGDPRAVHRHVEVDAHQHLLAGQSPAGRRGLESLISARMFTSRDRCRERDQLAPGTTLTTAQRPVGQPSAELAIAAAVSTMRFEKPHSLSYQLTTRTSLPSSTAVSRLSTVELARRVDDVDRDQRLVGVVENALQPAAFATPP